MFNSTRVSFLAGLIKVIFQSASVFAAAQKTLEQNSSHRLDCFGATLTMGVGEYREDELRGQCNEIEFIQKHLFRDLNVFS